MRNYILLFAMALLCSGCVTVPDVEVCSVAGVMSAGAVCVHTNNDQERDMDMDQFLTFLEPTDLADGAKCMSAADYNKVKTTIEVLCRQLGKRCKYELR